MRLPYPLLFVLLASSIAVRAETVEADIVIFGASSGGAAAAVQAKRLGKSAVIAEWTQHFGGLTTGGLGATDIGNKAAIGGIAREFYEQIATWYDKPEAWNWEEHQAPAAGTAGQEKGRDPLVEKTGRPTKWTFEPKVAAAIYEKWLKDAGVKVYLGEKLKSVKKEGTKIVEFTTESGRVYRGKMFIDASYEGDLMAKAGVTYHVGREANAEYQESLNGVRAKTPSHQFTIPVDPYVKPGDPSSGLLPFIQSGDGGKPGAGDKSVQAYNFRLCMTRTEANRVPWSEIKPAGYDEAKWELLARYIEAREKAGKPLKVGALMNPVRMPNDKTDTNNNGAFSTDFIGANYDYADGDYATRERIWKEHVEYTKGFLYFLSSSGRVPQRLRDEMNTWGFAKDEFLTTGGFPTQMYVREARRMISDYVMTEANCRWLITAEDPVGMGAYNMDSHNCQRLVQGGVARNEGDVQVGVAAPYPVSYRSIIPKADQAENLLVPVCLAATHIAYGSIRMEPVFMIMGQSAATAAVQAMAENVPVQKIAYDKLKARLLQDGQVLEWTGPVKPRPAPLQLTDGLIVDDDEAQLTGEWQHGSLSGTQAIGEGYLHDGNEQKGDLKITWTPKIEAAGEYEIFFYYPPNANRTKKAPVTVSIPNSDTKLIEVDEQEKSGKVSLGRFKLPAGNGATITLTNADTTGYVVADGLHLVKVP